MISPVKSYFSNYFSFAANPEKNKTQTKLNKEFWWAFAKQAVINNTVVALLYFRRIANGKSQSFFYAKMVATLAAVPMTMKSMSPLVTLSNIENGPLPREILENSNKSPETYEERHVIKDVVTLMHLADLKDNVSSYQ